MSGTFRNSEAGRPEDQPVQTQDNGICWRIHWPWDVEKIDSECQPHTEAPGGLHSVLKYHDNKLLVSKPAAGPLLPLTPANMKLVFPGILIAVIFPGI